MIDKATYPSLIEGYTQAEAFYKEAKESFRKMDQYDQVELIKQLPALFSLIETLCFRYQEWVEHNETLENKEALKPYKQKYQNLCLTLGMDFSYLCNNILTYDFSVQSIKKVKRFQQLNTEAMQKI